MNSLQSNKFSVSERIKLLASFVPKKSVICDVGSDHAILPIYLLNNKIVDRIIISDVNELPLQRAKNNISSENLSENVSFFLTDGISQIYENFSDVSGFVIAGMSGETIIHILDSAKDKIKKSDYFILQPMTRDYLLRDYLYKSGFDIIEEKCASENDKVFVIIFAKFSDTMKEYDKKFCYVGEFTENFDNESKIKYLNTKIFTLKTKIEGKKKAGISFEAEEEMLSYIKERFKNENL